MIIKLVLSTGKEIELTEDEFNELKNGKMLMSDERVALPYYPVYPYHGTTAPWTYPTVTYSTGRKE